MTKQLSFFSIWEDHPYHGTMSSLLMNHGLRLVDDPSQADILVFNGGQDIATEIYNETPIFGGIPHKMTRRDHIEVGLYDEYVGRKFMLGICRGAQLLNCLNGGKLFQHVNNHGHDHDMLDLISGEIITVTSTHHQMMRPNLKLGKILGIASESSSHSADNLDETLKPNSKELAEGKDIEVVWYPNTRSLCIQGHPEYVPGSRFAEWSLNLMETKYKEQLVCVV